MRSFFITDNETWNEWTLQRDNSTPTACCWIETSKNVKIFLRSILFSFLLCSYTCTCYYYFFDGWRTATMKKKKRIEKKQKQEEIKSLALLLKSSLLAYSLYLLICDDDWKNVSCCCLSWICCCCLWPIVLFNKMIWIRFFCLTLRR